MIFSVSFSKEYISLIEAIEIKTSQGGIQYRAHVANIGWQGWVRDGATAGTTGQGRKIEALEIRIVGGGPDPIPNEDWVTKANNFLNDPRWRVGIVYGYNQKPKLSGYGSKGCSAYAADFVKYVFDKNSPRSGVHFP